MGDDDEVTSRTERTSKRRTAASSRSPARRAATRRRAPEEPEDDSELAVRSRKLFLREIERQLRRPQLYNLENEFAKTRRNRTPVVALSVALFVVVMVSAAIIVTGSIQRSGQRVPVNITAFQDVNLMELLDRAKQLEGKITVANRNLETLQANEADEVSTVQVNAAQEIQIVENELISHSARQARIVSIRSRAQADLRRIQQKYAGQITATKAQIASLENEAAQYDTRQMKQARKEQEVLNNQQELFDLQLKQSDGYYRKRIAEVTNHYVRQIASINRHDAQLVDLMRHNQAVEIARLVSKFNPSFTSPPLAALIHEPVPNEGANPAVGAREQRFLRTLVDSGVVSGANVNDLEQRIGDFSRLLTALQKVPYENSVPPALAHLGYYNRRIIEDFQTIGQGVVSLVGRREREVAQLQKRLERADGLLAARNTTIGEFTYALNALVHSSGENGYILDARDPQRIAVFVDPLYRIRSGETAYVFRRDDQRIGTIGFTVSDGKITARQLTLSNQQVPIEPFDKILLDLKQGAGM